MENLMNFVKKYYSNEKWVSNTLFKIGLGLVVSYSSTVLTLYFMRDNWSWWWVSLPLVFLFMIANPSGGFVNAQDQEKSTDEIIAS
jgi:ABC-type dipeptide/oligopeptide/nickel transport system permease component